MNLDILAAIVEDPSHNGIQKHEQVLNFAARGSMRHIHACIEPGEGRGKRRLEHMHGNLSGNPWRFRGS